MGFDFGNIISAAIDFPAGSGLGFLIYGLIKGVYGLAGDYGIAILLFTLVIRLIMLPLDLGNKYFTKKNQMKLAEFKPEIDNINKIYANDMLARNRAQQAIYRKNGYSQGGFCLFMIINMAVTLIVFITVFGCLRDISNFNINKQFVELQGVYQEYDAGGSKADLGLESEEFKTEINEKYEETTVPFLWVNNIWRPDSFSTQTLSWSEFRSSVGSVKGNVFTQFVFDSSKVEGYDEMTDGEKNQARADARTQYETGLRTQYAAIFGPVASEHKGWNGLLLLVLLSGVTMYISTAINMSAMKKKAEEKKTEAEPIVQYSMRSVKDAIDGPELPQINPAMMGNVMKFVLPMVMVIFTISSTAALALYITAGAVISIGLTYINNLIVDRILAKQQKKEKPESGSGIINPHAKYFKTKH